MSFRNRFLKIDVKMSKLFSSLSIFKRNMSILSKALKYSEYGEPIKVIKLCEENLSNPSENEVLVKILASPLNPADINTIQGKYPVKPVLPAVAGNECVAEILSTGTNVKLLAVGDHVIPRTSGLGTWRTHALFFEKDLYKIPKSVDLAMASAMTVNPGTAYRMLNDFCCLKPGDTVIQNGANSAVGQLVFQICKKMGVNCVGVVRNRPEINELVDYLKKIGATEVLTEEELRTTTIFKSSKISRPILALDCVGGKNALEVIRNLGENGKIVTYGGMSREAVSCPPSALIFKNIQLNGFWMTRWTKENYGTTEQDKMFDELFKLVEEGVLLPPVYEMLKFSDYEIALKNALNMKGFTGKKFIIDFTKN